MTRTRSRALLKRLPDVLGSTGLALDKRQTHAARGGRQPNERSSHMAEGRAQDMRAHEEEPHNGMQLSSYHSTRTSAHETQPFKRTSAATIR